MRSTKVRMRRDGDLLSVETLTPDICQALEEALSYTKVVQLRGDEARRARNHIRLEPVDCFEYRGGGNSGLPVRLVTNPGFLSKICKVLRVKGFVPVLYDVRLYPHPEIFEPMWERVKGAKWKWKQKNCICQMLARHECRIGCPTGYGKSFMIAKMAELLPRAKIAVTTHSVDVIEQIFEELQELLPDVGLTCGRKKLTGKRVTCYSGKSLHHCQVPPDILFVDECHEWATEDYLSKLALPQFRFSRKYGFSASQEDRGDKAHFELEGPLGPVVIDIPYQDAVVHHCVVPIQVHWRDVVMDSDPCEGYESITSKERHGIWQNEIRNTQIVEDARFFAKDYQVLVAVDTIEHAMFIKQQLHEAVLCYSEHGVTDEMWQWYIDCGFITERQPRMTLKRRRWLKKQFESGKIHLAIANSVWKRGVDFRRLSVLIRADAKSSAIADKQLPGRTSRLCEEIHKEFAIVVDYKDQFNNTFRGRAEDRRRNYKKNGWEQIEPKRGKSRFRQAYLF